MTQANAGRVVQPRARRSVFPEPADCISVACRSRACAASMTSASSLDPGLNVLIGPNGAGKSSVLEAVYLLSHGRSFRSGARDALVQRGRDRMSVYAEVVRCVSARVASPGPGAAGRSLAGAYRRRGRAHAGRAGRPLCRDLFRAGLPCPDRRARPKNAVATSIGVCSTWNRIFFEHWRRYQRALRQRNALLRQAGTRCRCRAALDPGRPKWRVPARRIDAARRAATSSSLRPAPGAAHAGACCPSWAPCS